MIRFFAPLAAKGFPALGRVQPVTSVSGWTGHRQRPDSVEVRECDRPVSREGVEGRWRGAVTLCLTVKRTRLAMPDYGAPGLGGTNHAVVA